MKKNSFSLDFRSGSPIYVQIIDQIKHRIAAGDLVPGDQLPTVRQLAADLRVNFNTIARAYRLLDESGIISTQHGRGTFILAPPSDELIARMRQDDLLRLTVQYLDAVHHLGYQPEEVLEFLREQIRKRDQNGTPPSDQQ